MDIDLLRTFMEVRRLGNFRSAAENLHVTQAAVSQRIKHLESILNASLFIREKNNIYPTPAGEQLVAAAESILTTWQAVRRDISLTEDSGPSLSIAAKAGVWDLYGHSWLRYMADVRPDMSFQADVLGEDLMLKRLLAQTLDTAFLLMGCELDSLNCEPVASFELALYGNGAQTLAQALQGPYVHVDWGRDIGALYTAKLGFREPPRLRTGDHRVARRFIESGGGSALLPVMPPTMKSALEVVTDSPRIRREIFAAWHRKNPHQAVIAELVEGLRSVPGAALALVS